jgi:hypothetical protein
VFNISPIIGSANVSIINLQTVEMLNLTFSKEFDGMVTTQGNVSNSSDYWEADLVCPFLNPKRIF